MRKLRIEQMVYGYNHGHTQMASSLHQALANQDIIDALSDSSGRGVFSEYLTCYPLVSDRYYVFQMTWPAEDMHRPGCVWSHVLLLPLDHLNKYHFDGKSIRALFRKPSVQESFSSYCKTIFLEETVNQTSERRRAEPKHFNYLIYTVFSSNKKIFVGDNEGFEYSEAMIELLLRLPTAYLSEFTACTCSLSNRYYRKELFSYQITQMDRSKSLSLDADEAVIYKPDMEGGKYPFWSSYLANKLFKNKAEDIFRFVKLYGKSDRESVKELSKVFYSSGEFVKKQNLDDYYEMLDKISGGEAYISATENAIYEQDETEFDKFFDMNSIVKHLLKGILGESTKKKLPKSISPKKAERYSAVAYSSADKEEIRKLFEAYVHNQLDDNGKILLKSIQKKLCPEDLETIFGFDLALCSVVIRLRPELAKCERLWENDKNFQLEILAALLDSELTQEEKREISDTIIDNSNEDISKMAGKVLGNSLQISIFEHIISDLNADSITPQKHINYGLWLPEMMANRDLYFRFMRLDLNYPLLKIAMSCVNSYSIVDAEERKQWMKQIERSFSNICMNDSYQNALFAVPLILWDGRHISDEVGDWAFSELNSRLEESRMDFSDWMNLSKILPNVSVENSWDKCLRLRMGFHRA